jgi:hypothetical protein
MLDFSRLLVIFTVKQGKNFKIKGMKKNILVVSAIFCISAYNIFAQLSSPVLHEPPKEVDVVVFPVTLDWNDVPGAICYRVEVYTDTTSPDKFEGTCNAPTSHFELPVFETDENTVYYWRVYACGTSGWSVPSEYFSFRTQASDAAGSIGNMVDGVIDLIADEDIPPNQGNILINRLEKAQIKMQQGNKFVALLNIVLFKARVTILRASNVITQDVYSSLNYSADGVIDLIADEDNPNPIAVNVEDYIVPKAYELSQNYPNPFNPSTSIEFSIPSDAAVSLKVYDVLGKEVAVLVNEQRNAGTYIINWNASNLSSGVYFYRLNAGNFTQTRKMFLAK